MPTRCAAMHPLPDRDVAVAWRSPIQGRVSVTASVAMADAQGGNGIEWAIVHEGKSGPSVLDRGAIGTGGSQSIPATAGDPQLGKLQVEVEKGDTLSLVVGARDRNHFCDTTLVDLSITEAGPGGRTWSLVKEVVGSVHDGNPHADAAGHAGVWRFYSVPPVAMPPEPSRPPFDRASRAASAREFLRELAAKKLTTIRER